jgi:hypothetical protein
LTQEIVTKSFYLARHAAQGELTDEQACLNCKLTPASCGDLLSGCEMAQRDLLRLVASANKRRTARLLAWERQNRRRGYQPRGK